MIDISKFTVLICVLLVFESRAAIVYNNINDYYLDYGDSYAINMDNYDGIDISFLGDGFGPIVGNLSSYFGKLACKPGSSTDVRALASGTSIGSSLNWSGGGGNLYINGSSAPNEFATGQNRYIGVRLNTFGTTYYGWVMVEYTTSTIIIKSYAYQNTPGVAISAGSTSGGGSSVSLEEVEEELFQIYPNPSQGLINMTYNPQRFQMDKLVLFDINGREIPFVCDQDIFGTMVINLGGLECGSYYIQMISMDAILTRELKIIR